MSVSSTGWTMGQTHHCGEQCECCPECDACVPEGMLEARPGCWNCSALACPECGEAHFRGESGEPRPDLCVECFAAWEEGYADDAYERAQEDAWEAENV